MRPKPKPKSNSAVRKFAALFSAILGVNVVFSSCEKPSEPIDPLDEIGLLGKWLRDTTFINGLVVSTNSVDTLLFTTRATAADINGEYVTSRPGYTAGGEFYLDTVNETIQYGINDTTPRNFEVNANRLVFRFVIGPKVYRDCWGRVE